MSSNTHRAREKTYVRDHRDGHASPTKPVNTVIPDQKGEKVKILSGEAGLNYNVEGER